MPPSKPLADRPTHERTLEELQRGYEAYVQSKTVDGRFCPTPEPREADTDE